MSLASRDKNMIVRDETYPLADDFEVCWASELRAPLLPNALCYGSVDGKLRIVDHNGDTLGESRASVSGSAINGVAQVGTWLAVSTPQEVTFWSAARKPTGYIPIGVHGITATPTGLFAAPAGRSGILTARLPMFGNSQLAAYVPHEDMSVYRVIGLRSETRKGDVLACATRSGGIVTGEFTGEVEAQQMTVAKFKNLDVVDICPLTPPDSLAIAALGRDGTLILSRNVLKDKKPLQFKFRHVRGVGYRVLSHAGDIYILTSKALHVLANLGARFLSNQPMEGTTYIFPMPIEAVDMAIAWDRWLLVVLVNAVRKFDLDEIHGYIPQHIGQAEIEESQPDILPFEGEWSILAPTLTHVSMAG